jgi:hypothetical protein
MLVKSCLAMALLLAGASAGLAQTTQNLRKSAPDGAVIAYLLTDGTVLVQGNAYSDWWKLTPDITGSYTNGAWTRQADLPAGYAPYANASDVLADGRLVIAGGEYNNGVFAFTDTCAVYDPVANSWTEFAPPAGWDFIGDSPSVVLPDGGLLLGRKFDRRIAVLNPATLTWTELKDHGKKDFNAEEGWTLLPDGNVLTYDVKAAPNSEVYNPVQQFWSTAGSTVANLAGPPEAGAIHYGNGRVYHPPGETGPGVLRPDGTVFATGATNKGANFGHTAIYTPRPKGMGKGAGTWAAGPDFPAGENAGDSFAALLPTGNVLVEATQGALLEFNGSTLTQTKFNGQGGSLLVLPTGEVLVNGAFVYIAAGSVNPAWAPAITAVPAVLTPGDTYTISGTQFNGLSQAHAFGDELQTATNYPLVRITNAATGHVFYARTHDHSTMAVATGKAVVSTNFDVPAGIETGSSALAVVANGIPSPAMSVTIE